MFFTNSPNAIEHADADCNCASSQNVSFINKTNDVKKSGKSTEQYRDNVISITAAIKSAGKVSSGQMNVKKAGKVKFIYPMLECV